MNYQNSTDFNIYAPISGSLIALKELPDPLIAQGMLGLGLAIQAVSNELIAPVSGTLNYLDSGVVLITRKDGLQVLLQIGIDTAILKGAPFVLQKPQQTIVTTKSVLMMIDLKSFWVAHLKPIVILTLPNLSNATTDLRIKYRQVIVGDLLYYLAKNNYYTKK